MRLHGDVLRAGHHHFIVLRRGVFQAPYQDACVAVLQQQHCGQQQRMNFADAPLNQAGIEAGVAHHADRLVRTHRAGQRQIGEQRLRGTLAPVVARQPDHRMQQRVVDPAGRRTGAGVGGTCRHGVACQRSDRGRGGKHVSAKDSGCHGTGPDSALAGCLARCSSRRGACICLAWAHPPRPRQTSAPCSVSRVPGNVGSCLTHSAALGGLKQRNWPDVARQFGTAEFSPR